jgi:preprotein translocase subunit SecE
MAKQNDKPGIIERVKEFLEEVKAEMKKVSWPTREEVKASTQVVLFLLVVLAAIVFIYDRIFSFAVLGLFRLFT